MRGGHLGFRALVVQEDRRYVLEMVLSYGIKTYRTELFPKSKERSTTREQKNREIGGKNVTVFTLLLFFFSTPFSDLSVPTIPL